jgi:hypothetical protein
MTTNARFNQAEKSFELIKGEFDTSVTLVAPTKAKLLQGGGMQSAEFNEGDNMLELGTNYPNDSGNVTGGYFSWYNQANIDMSTRLYAGKDSRYGYLIYRQPDIPSTSTWGGMVIVPPDAVMRQYDKRWRLSFDYRGNTGGATLDVYQNYSVGWGNSGVGLPGAWDSGISAFDTDWLWMHYEYEFDINNGYIDYVVTGSYDWNSTTQYPGGDYGIAYNGYVYRHRSANPVPTLGVDPETEYIAGGIYDAKYPQTPGYFDIYNQIKIGFNYNTQGSRGTHVYLDNIYLTDITDNNRFKYNLSTASWDAESLTEETMHIVAVGTGLMTLPRSDAATLDIFAVEGNRTVTIDDTVVYNGTGRGLVLTIIDEATRVLGTQTVYDVYGSDQPRTDLAIALAAITVDKIWVLTSFDALNTNTALTNQMQSMGSVLYVNDGNPYSIFTGGGIRHTYACVGRGQRILREDGANASDTKYKRKAVIDIRV